MNKVLIFILLTAEIFSQTSIKVSQLTVSDTAQSNDLLLLTVDSSGIKKSRAIKYSTLKSNINDYISIADSGAIGDGTTDNSSKIQSVINRAAAIGVPVFVPKGDFLISNTLVIGANTKIYGIKGESIIKLKSGTNKAILRADSSAGIWIEGITFITNDTGWVSWLGNRSEEHTSELQ